MGQAATPPAPFLFFMKSVHYPSLFAVLVLTTFQPVVAQGPQKAPAVDPAAATKQSLSFAEHGKCKEALQLLRKSSPRLVDKESRLKADVAAMQCAINRDQTDAAVDAVQLLNREFPHDPEVLYVTTHAYSDLSTRASLELARTAPDSYQAHEMNAEALELQGKWDEAEKEYQGILAKNPDLPGIHFRLGRLLLSRPNPGPDAMEAAKQQFQKELEVDPRNAGAEYVLGELARQQSQWPDAIDHFGKASKLDPGLTDALLGLGMALISDGKAGEAIPPLENYVKLQPGNPAGHYQLAMAYSRTGRREEARREAALQRETAQKIEEEKQKLAGPAPQAPAPTEQKPDPRH
jgi:predicted Zn-dependent protease